MRPERSQGTLKVEIVAADGGVVFAKTIPADMMTGIRQLFCERIDTNTLQGTHAVRAQNHRR